MSNFVHHVSHRVWLIFILLLSLDGCVLHPAVTEEDAIAYQKVSNMQAGLANAALMQQMSSQLVAPDVQRQLQVLADEIGRASAVDIPFRVHLINGAYLATMSMPSGDIFIPIPYLTMVSNRDEMAFGLAREIAIQHQQLPLRDMEEQYRETEAYQAVSLVYGIVFSIATQAVFDHYVSAPIHRNIMKSFRRPASDFGSALIYSQTSRNLYQIVNYFLGWIPMLAYEKSLPALQSLMKLSAEDADATRRQLKNEAGLEYMKKAGFNSSAGEAVIAKLEEYWNRSESVEQGRE